MVKRSAVALEHLVVDNHRALSVCLRGRDRALDLLVRHQIEVNQLHAHLAVAVAVIRHSGKRTLKALRVGLPELVRPGIEDVDVHILTPRKLHGTDNERQEQKAHNDRLPLVVIPEVVKPPKEFPARHGRRRQLVVVLPLHVRTSLFS